MSITAAELKEYFENSRALKALDTRQKSLNKKFKEFMLPAGLKEFGLGGYKAKITPQDRSKMDEIKTLELLKGKGLEELVVLKETFEQEAVESAMLEGKIKPEELETCVIPNIIYTLKVIAE